MARIHRKPYKKGLNDTDNHDGVVTHLEPDVLEYELKWALESVTTNKARGGDEIPTELFQILKDGVVKSAELNMQANLENSAVATGQEKVSFHSNPNEIALISHASKVMLKILKARLQQYMNRELLDVQAEFIPSEEPEIKLPASTGS